MIRFRLVFYFCGMMAMGLYSSAQSIQHTTWKAYFLVMHDSVTMRFTADSMTVKSDSGHVLLQSAFTDSNNIVTLQDYGGLCSCPNFLGRYQAKMTSDTLIMILYDDYCDLRRSTLIAKWWVRAPEPVKPPEAAKPVQGKKKRKGG